MKKRICVLSEYKYLPTELGKRLGKERVAWIKEVNQLRGLNADNCILVIQKDWDSQLRWDVVSKIDTQLAVLKQIRKVQTVDVKYDIDAADIEQLINSNKCLQGK